MICKNCNTDMPEPPPKIQVVKETSPCRCGMTEETRKLRMFLRAVIIGGLILLGGCFIEEYFSTEQVKAVKAGELKVIKKDPGNSPFGGPYRVVPVEEKK